MERFQLIRKMYLQGTISLKAAWILAVTDEERQELLALHEFVAYQEDCDAKKNREIAYSWECYEINYTYYGDITILDCVYEMSRVSNRDNYCNLTHAGIEHLYEEHCDKIQDDFYDFEQITQYRKHHPIMTMREYNAYVRFSTHRREREIAEEWIAGNIVSVPRGLDLTYITSHYHTLLPYSPT